MKLSEYLKFKKITQTAACKEIGISRQMLNYILNGRARPGVDVIKKIISWSNGDVRFEDLTKQE